MEMGRDKANGTSNQAFLNDMREEAQKPAAVIHKPGVQSGKLRVAVYIRVSTDQDDQENSFETQERYFNRLLACNPDWMCVGLYADYGISGTAGGKRTGFKRMLRHCREGKIDRIVTKSISRFARNTADFMTALDVLHENNVSIMFEKEGLNTSDSASDFILTTLAAIAQEESRSISSNVNLGNKMRYLRGEVPNKEIYGYRYIGEYTVMGSGYRYRTVGVVEEEAKVVRWIYQSYIDGMEPQEIARELNRKNIPYKASTYVRKRMECSRKGQLHANLDEGWTAGMVGRILRNERYAGDVLAQKSYTVDYLTHKSIRNYGEVPQYYVRDHHPAIVSRETFETVKRIQEGNTAAQRKRREKKEYPFSGRLICGTCGRFYHIRNTRFHPIWYCPTNTRSNGRNICRGEKIYEEQVIRMLQKAVTERFCLTAVSAIDDVAAADIVSGNCRWDKARQIVFSAEEKGFVEQMLIRLVKFQQMDSMERDRAFLKRKVLERCAVLDSCRKQMGASGERKGGNHRFFEAEAELRAAEEEVKRAVERLEYMERYWEEIEADYDWRESAIGWMKGLPKGEAGVAAFLNGMASIYVKAFVISITIYDPVHCMVHWFDDTCTEVEMYSNIHDYRYTAAGSGGQAMGEGMLWKK